MNQPALDKLAEQLVCRHEDVSGGNDYLLCGDCGLMWDYTKLTPFIGLKMYHHPITKICTENG